MAKTDDIQSVRERLDRAAKDNNSHWSMVAGTGPYIDVRVSDLRALLADHARLVGEVEKASRGCGSGHSGEQPVINHGATAALAPLVQAWFDRWGLSDVDTPDARELRARLAGAHNFNIFPGKSWAGLSPEARVSAVLASLKAPSEPLDFNDRPDGGEAVHSQAEGGEG